jgi:chromosome segregation protein
MLKALELVGFKSFADRTRFDFPEGITVVVGPNGSGKSNVVDAIKWVLGTQSAKALRGSEMSDVIFKGSAEGGRKPANSAEVTLVLDNRTRILELDADEVEVSRRVYRSGEGEYSINARPCRLKDVRDLFRGTGVGVDAYSLIEQGKVDRLLQSSPKDRRSIFEEAAGISRFKARKAEAEKRLSRVDQNMVRLHDIVEEVGGRLQTLKNQATRAQRYRELTAQMHRKRVQLGRLEHRELQENLQQVVTRIAEADEQREQLQSQSVEVQRELDAAVERQQQLQNELAACNRDILDTQTSHAQKTAELTSSRQRHLDWVSEQSSLRDRIESLQRRVTLSESEINDRRNELQELEEQRKLWDERALQIEKQATDQEATVIDSRNKLDVMRGDTQAARDRIAKCRYDITLHETQLEQATDAIDRTRNEHSGLIGQMEKIQANLDQLTRQNDQVQTQHIQAQSERDAAVEELNEASRQQDEQRQNVLDLQSRVEALRERYRVLEQLEDQFTVAEKGGQQLIRATQRLVDSVQESDRFSIERSMIERGAKSIQGIVADLISSDLHLAPLVDVALGSHADAVVLADGQVVDWIQEGRIQPEGRVTLLRLDRLPARRTGEKIQLDGLRGVLGRADRLVRFATTHEHLVRSLLGTTWFVESLTTALELSHLRGAGLRFVTAECQLIDSDGSITIGSLQAGLGLVSRRSEMLATQEQIDQLHSQYEEAKRQYTETQAVFKTASNRAREAESLVHQADRSLVTLQERISAMSDRAHAMQSDIDAKQLELAERVRYESELLDLIANRKSELEQLQQTADECHKACSTLERELEGLESISRQFNNDLVEKRVETARLEQRIDGLRTTLDQLLQDTHERNHHVQVAQDGLDTLDQKLVEIQASIDLLKVQIEATEEELTKHQQRRHDANSALETHQSSLQEITKNRDSMQRQLDKWSDRKSTHEQEQTRLADEIQSLLVRYRNDYQIELGKTGESEQADFDSDDQINEDENQDEIKDEVQDEIQDDPDVDRYTLEAQIGLLRQELSQSGSVNLEALEELEHLQSRYDTLSGHERDLLEAKSTLIKTMQKIDTDSQSLFLETLEAIRTNFQTLYRKSFGGGHADIVLENPNDPESGIEILATPPGKTTFSNSLLSGGEKALTAVALIMAFFQYRPSPFCVLDEVDAPFDEANIGRFVSVLNEFLDTTKFIVVTHSKKTMTVADMIYGVTMQESGVSRQVSVKFEEVNDRGEPLRREPRAA